MSSLDSHYILYYSYLILIISSVHAYAFVVSFINYRHLRTDLGKKVVGLNGMSALHGFSQFSIFLPVSSDIKFVLTHILFMETYLILIFYLKAICAYLHLKIRGLNILQNLFYFSLFLVFIALIYLLYTGNSLIFEQSMLKTDNILYNYNEFPITPNKVSHVFIGVGMLGFMLFCLKSIYEMMNGGKSDYFLISGMITSILANMNDASILYGNFKYTVPLFVVSNFIECGRMTYVTQRNTFLRFAESNALANSVRRIIHDVRRPFSYLKIFMINLSRHLEGQDEKILLKINTLKSNLEKSHQDVEKMLGELLDIGREIRVEKVSFPIGEVLDECLQEFFEFEERPDWETKVLKEHKSEIYADREKIKRVLENIISNAIKQAWQPGDQKKELLIKTSTRGKFFKIVVINTGSVIEPERINSIFNQFYTRNNIHGKGIGLAICKKYVELHGGSIRCSSDKETRKTSFIIEIPLPSHRV